MDREKVVLFSSGIDCGYSGLGICIICLLLFSHEYNTNYTSICAFSIQRLCVVGEGFLSPRLPYEIPNSDRKLWGTALFYFSKSDNVSFPMLLTMVFCSPLWSLSIIHL